MGLKQTVTAWWVIYSKRFQEKSTIAYEPTSSLISVSIFGPYYSMLHRLQQTNILISYGVDLHQPMLR